MRGGIWLRIALQGFVTVLLAFTAVGWVSSYLARGEFSEELAGLSRFCVIELERVEHDQAALETKIAELRDGIGVLSITIYEPDGTVVAATGAPVTPTLFADEIGRLPNDPVELKQRDTFAASFGSSGRYALIRMRGPPFRPPILIVAVVVTIVTVTIASIPLARSVAIPLRRLVEVVDRFARGDSSARTNIRRRDEIGMLARAFDELADRVVALRRSEKELIANVSHELRTPLARMGVVLELAASRAAAPPLPRYMAELSTDLRDLERLVDDLLTGARTDAVEGHFMGDGPASRRVSVDVAQTAREELSRFLTRNPSCEVALELDTHATHEVFGDGPLLARAFANLLDNARKYSPPEESIRVTARSAKHGFEVIVEDRGPGIPSDKLPQLFGAFFRVDDSRDRATGGVGLGLHLAKRIIEAHGGTLSYEPAQGGGARFSARFPHQAPSAVSS